MSNDHPLTEAAQAQRTAECLLTEAAYAHAYKMQRQRDELLAALQGMIARCDANPQEALGIAVAAVRLRTLLAHATKGE